MDTLMAYCKAEGDFKWGVAIHPYPENLLDPKAWLDKKNTYATDTPYITFKNLEVLDDWIKHTASTYENGHCYCRNRIPIQWTIQMRHYRNKPQDWLMHGKKWRFATESMPTSRIVGLMLILKAG